MSMPGVAIIGSGFGGLAMAYYLKKAGLTDFTIYEKAENLGGTWRENTYPGAACDVASHLYSYSFEPRYPWAYRYGKQSEILAYLQHVAAKFGLLSHLRFGMAVTRADFDEVHGLWTLCFADGSRARHQVVITSVGQLHQPRVPNIKGAETFQGAMFHSACWRHDYDFEGKRVAVVGTGPSAVQFVPAIRPAVARMHVFQRSPGWTVPKFDRRFNALERALLRFLPVIHDLDRARIFWTYEFLGSALMRQSRFHKPARAIFANAAKWLLKVQIKDPDLRRKLTPDYPIGCKRALLSNEWLPALAAPNVELVTDGIAEIVPNGIRAGDGRLREVDAILWGTGFEATQFLAPIRITGRGGKTLDEAWQGGAEAFMGMAVNGFPNLFMLYGPNTNLGAGSIIYMLEAQAKYLAQAVELLAERHLRWIDVKRGIQDAYNAMLRKRNAEDAVFESGCHSWYLTADGRNTVSWVGFMHEYARQVKTFDAEHFEQVGDPARRPETIAEAA